MTATGQGCLVEANGLPMYLERHGATNPTGQRPLVVLHGAFGSAEGWAGHLPALRENRDVVLVEQQGHGHTADREGALTYEGMADDTAALMRATGLEGADVFGYSDGGTVGLALAIRHPGIVGKLAILGAGTGTLAEVYEPEDYAEFAALPDDFSFPVIREPYERAAPDPTKWPVLVRKIKALGFEFAGFSESEARSIRCPTLILQGDRDVIRPEHAVEMFRRIPRARLAILPNADHFAIFTTPEVVLAPLLAFLDGPDDAVPAPL